MTVATNLASPVSYTAREALEFLLTFSVSESGSYYVLGALYDSNLNYISGTLFGVLRQGELPADYLGVNSQTGTTLWTMLEDEEVELDCRFVFGQSSVTMGLFLMRMTGDEPSLDDDEEIASTAIVLEGPPAPLDMGSIIGLVIAIGIMGVMVKMVK